MVRHLVLRLSSDIRAATAVEYGLLLALLVLGIIGGVTAVGEGTANNLDSAVEAFPDA